MTMDEKMQDGYREAIMNPEQAEYWRLGVLGSSVEDRRRFLQDHPEVAAAVARERAALNHPSPGIRLLDPTTFAAARAARREFLRRRSIGWRRRLSEDIRALGATVRGWFA